MKYLILSFIQSGLLFKFLSCDRLPNKLSFLNKFIWIIIVCIDILIYIKIISSSKVSICLIVGLIICIVILLVSLFFLSGWKFPNGSLFSNISTIFFILSIFSTYFFHIHISLRLLILVLSMETSKIRFNLCEFLRALIPRIGILE